MPDPIEDNKEKDSGRRRMVVEEVSDLEDKVEELRDLTEHIAEDVKDSVEIQEEIKEVVEDKPVEEFVAPVQAPTFNPLIIILPGFLLLGILLGGFVFYQKMMNKTNSEIVITPAPVVSETSPTPSVSASPVPLTKYSVAIQNGSGIAGEAGKVKTLLEAAGFKVSGTANASTYDFTKTIVKVKVTVEKDYLDALVKALEKNYQVDKTQTLTTSSTDDVQVIVGSLKSLD